MREGAAERLLSRGRALLPLLGWTERRRREFLSMRHPEQQILYWRQVLDSQRWRATIDVLLSAWLLGAVYASPFAAALPRRFGARVRARLERGWAHHANQSNPYAWRLLMGESQALEAPPTPAIRFACADAAAYLESCNAGSFDAFSLSNIGDGASPSYKQRLHAAVAHAAAPFAVVVIRSFADPAIAVEENCAARDRSLIWGSVQVKRIGERSRCFTC